MKKKNKKSKRKKRVKRKKTKLKNIKKVRKKIRESWIDYQKPKRKTTTSSAKEKG